MNELLGFIGELLATASVAVGEMLSGQSMNARQSSKKGQWLPR